ncbi:PDR/VanB family oxidoreductase [Neobacillus rhizosphaerae]|uniref:PDR/VanB family oxidoreductase n=1 Tax=Neobacillus rhizosphaerae TaxID=2880965 RepID=UPI003D2916A2
MVKEKTIPVYVKSIIQETTQVKRFTLAPVEETLLPSFSAGSHITTYIDGKERNYSLTNHPDTRDSYQIAIRLSESSTGGSVYWHQKVKVGETLRISYPRNHFPLSFKAKHHVFYAAGIGVTPFISMMLELKDKGSSFELHYAAKSKELCAFFEFLQTNFPLQSHFYFSKGNEAKRLRETTLLEHRIGTHVYFCGPDSFMTDFTEAATRFGYPRSSIHLERFAPPRPKNASPFQVQLTRGVEIHVGKNQSLLDALLAEGIKVPYSCRVGRCGTCELKVVEGGVDHYDSFFSEQQQNAQSVILTCVSRAKSGNLVIDF